MTTSDNDSIQPDPEAGEPSDHATPDGPIPPIGPWASAVESDESASANAPVPSPYGGMGAVLHAEGTTFRVWAPKAEAVSVKGSFNGESADAHPLARDGDSGYWSVDVPGVKAGDTYRFVIRTPDGRVLERRDPYARDLTHSVGVCVVTDPAFDWGESDYRSPEWDDLVIYELHVGTFTDLVEGAEPGNLEGVIRRLDYVKELGFNCIELMPTGEFAMSHSLGYNPAHIFAVEEAYGGPNGLKTLVKEAHARGIAVILDVVYNHFGPSDLDLWQFDGWTENGKGGIYFYEDWRSSTPWGDTRPDYRRGEVRQFIRDNALFWLEEFRFDGLRWDATGQIRNARGGNHSGDDLPDGWELMRWVSREVDARQPWKLLIAEDLQTNAAVTRDVDDGGAGFDSQWDAQFVHPVREALITRDDASRHMHAVAHAIRFSYDGDPNKRVIYTESHDEVMNGRARVTHDVNPQNAASWESQKRSTLGGALVFTAPGIPMIFQGQEFLEDGWFVDTDPLDWTKLERFAGIHHMYRDLVHLRRNAWGTTAGLRGPHVQVHHVNDADKVVAFHRWRDGGPGDDVIVIANFANRAHDEYRVGVPRDGEWKVRFNGDWNGYSPDFGSHHSWHAEAEDIPWDGMPFSIGVGLGPYTALILSQD
ncbi:MAG TPA: alpha-amylase family glycosyl hydrolase [Longimicrobium sp.]|nr:alpha-amylase family glycosyl hydrolase [Longimicrobium sp.]